MTDTTSLFTLAEADNAEGLLAALSTWSDTLSPLSEHGETLYLFCLYRGRAKCLEALEARGNLSLQEAAAAGDAHRITACLDSAAWSIRTLSGDGWTALHLAAFLGRDEALRVLLARGADARQWSRAADANLALHAACAGRRLGKDAFGVLIAATGDPDIAQKAGYTALMIAAANGFSDAVDALLEAGADHGKKSPDGKTAADFARDRGHAEIAARLG